MPLIVFTGYRKKFTMCTYVELFLVLYSRRKDIEKWHGGEGGELYTRKEGVGGNTSNAGKKHAGAMETVFHFHTPHTEIHTREHFSNWRGDCGDVPQHDTSTLLL